MNEKEKCKYLKAVRKGLADQLGVELHQTECTFKGKCKGTCPKCRSEERLLNSALLKRAAVLSATVLLSGSLAACTPEVNTPTDLSGDVQVDELGGAVPVDTLEGDVVIDTPDDDVAIETLDGEVEIMELEGMVPSEDVIDIDEPVELEGEVPAF